jgi:hypothetical protein
VERDLELEFDRKTTWLTKHVDKLWNQSDVSLSESVTHWEKCMQERCQWSTTFFGEKKLSLLNLDKFRFLPSH